MKFKNQRTHDDFYAKEYLNKKPKEYFKYALEIFKKNQDFIHSECINMIDVGCASGDFLYFLENNNTSQSYRYHGLEFNDKCLKVAKSRFNNIEIKFGDINDLSLSVHEIFKKKFDIISMFGVHSIFDDLTWLKNIEISLSKNGFALLFGMFNPYPYDVLMRVGRSGKEISEPGWNVFSKETIISKCEELSLNAIFYEFEPDIELDINNNDYLRSWTVNVKTDSDKDVIEQKK